MQASMFNLPIKSHTDEIGSSMKVQCNIVRRMMVTNAGDASVIAQVWKQDDRRFENELDVRENRTWIDVTLAKRTTKRIWMTMNAVVRMRR